jgi:pimeloyl-ACP methyl ester carboxylesterase
MKNLLYILSLLIITGCSSTKNKSSHDIFTNKKGEQKYIAAYNASLKLWPVPYEEKNIQTSWGTAHVIITGPAKGEPLVLFHGMDASSTMWYPNIKDYSSKYRVYAIDYILEAGKSKLKDKRPNTDEVVQWYNEIFDALNLKKFNLIGASRGGWLATNYTLHHQNRVDKLVLLSPVQTFGLMEFNLKTRRAINFKFFPNRKRLRKTVEALSFYPEKINPKFKEQLYLGTEYSKTTFDMLEMAPFKDDLKNIKVPVLVLVGDHDILCGTDILESAKEKIPHAQTEVVPNAGHFLTIDQKEVVDKKILSFLNSK